MYLISIFTHMSDMRKRYAWRLAGRCGILIAAVVLCVVNPGFYAPIRGMGFFEGFSWLHVLWLIWVADMAAQVLPVRAHISLGSQKLWRMRFRPIREAVNPQRLKKHIADTSRAAGWVMLLWAALIAGLGLLHGAGVLTDTGLFLTAIVFYVCDLICVLIWCPFRLIMKNRCCTTCRIFNWDHLMMFSPLVFVPGFYCWSLLGLSIVAWLIWELAVYLHPERFWEGANAALTCASCTDKLCTQYCRKLGSAAPRSGAARNSEL